MPTRTIYLIRYPGARNQRAHFGIWVPYAEEGVKGTKVHVVGMPMAGFRLEFNRSYEPTASARRSERIPIGSVSTQHIYDYQGSPTIDHTPVGDLERTAAEVAPPRASKDIFAPVNDVSVLSQQGTLVC